MSAPHTPAVVAAAKALNKCVADDIGLDSDLMWKKHGHKSIGDAEAALEAVGFQQLLEALRDVTAKLSACRLIVTDSLARNEMTGSVEAAIAAIRKATGEPT